MLRPTVDLPTRRDLVPAALVLLWSTGFIGARLGLPHAEPLTFLTLRYVLVIVLMSAFVLIAGASWPRDWRQVVHIAVSGLLIQGVYLGGIYIAMHRGLPAGMTALIVGVQPLFTAVLAGWLLGPRIRGREWIGLALGLAGVVMVIGSAMGLGGVAPAALGPMLLPAIVALVAITAGTLYQTIFCPRFDLASGAIIQYIPSLLLTGLLAFTTETGYIAWSGEFVFALSWLAIVLSLGAITLFNLLLRSGSLVKVASLFYLVPPVTALLAWALFGETLTPVALVGMMVAVGGVWLTRRS